MEATFMLMPRGSLVAGTSLSAVVPPPELSSTSVTFGKTKTARHGSNAVLDTTSVVATLALRCRRYPAAPAVTPEHRESMLPHRSPGPEEIARRVLHETNLHLVEALEALGTRARPFTSGVVDATESDTEEVGLIGEITAVREAAIAQTARGGVLPIVAPLGESPKGQILVVHADSVARAIALALKPHKVVFLHEAGRAQPWRVTDAPADFIDGMLKGIVGLEIPITRLDGKWKMSQNRNAVDRAGVVQALRAAGDGASAAVADLVRGPEPGV